MHSAQPKYPESPGSLSEHTTATDARPEPTATTHYKARLLEADGKVRKRAQGLRLGVLDGRRSPHREPPSATTGSSQTLLLDNVGASGAARGRDERLWEDGPTRIESTGSTVSHGLPGARASTAALAHRQHLRADELMMLTLEALTTTGGTTTCHGAHRTSGEAGLSLGRQR